MLRLTLLFLFAKFVYSDWFYDEDGYGFYQYNTDVDNSPAGYYDYASGDYVYYDVDFTCEEKAGKGNITFQNSNATICSSGKCLVFYDFCDNFWATSCYEYGSPMKLAKNYKGVQKRIQMKKSTAKFYLCGSRNCTLDLSKELNPELFFFVTFIDPEPASFDFTLWPNLGKQPQQKNKNMKSALMPVETIIPKIEVIGSVLPEAKELWIQFQFLNKSGNLNNAEFIFDTFMHTVAYKYNGKMRKIQRWGGLNYQKNGEKGVNITYANLEVNQFFANNVNLNISLSKKVFGNISTVYYGGKWKSVQASNFNEELMYPRKSVKNISCDESYIHSNSTLNVTNLQKNYSNISSFKIPMFENFERKSFEFRDSLCPGADLLRIDITVVKHEKDFFVHPSMWYRENLKWKKFWNMAIRKQNCTEIQVTASSSTDIVVGNVVEELFNALKAKASSSKIPNRTYIAAGTAVEELFNALKVKASTSKILNSTSPKTAALTKPQKVAITMSYPKVIAVISFFFETVFSKGNATSMYFFKKLDPCVTVLI